MKAEYKIVCEEDAYYLCMYDKLGWIRLEAYTTFEKAKQGMQKYIDYEKEWHYDAEGKEIMEETK